MTGKQRESRAVLPLIAIGAGLLLLLTSVLWISQTNGGTTAGFPDPTPRTDQIPRVTLAEAKAAFDDGSAIFVDVRSSQDFSTGHITGAVSIPENELPARFERLNRDDWIIPYCT
jgi:hypothetical protein